MFSILLTLFFLIKSKHEEIIHSSTGEIILAALIGASAAILAQVIFFILNKRKERKNRIIFLQSELLKYTDLLEDHFRELALHKAHKFYWWAQYESNSDERNYEYHMKSSSKVRDTEIKIAKTFSQYHSTAIELQLLNKFNPEIQILINKYKSYEPKKPRVIKTNTTFTLQQLEAKEEARLKKEYNKFIKILYNINSILVKNTVFD